MVQGVFVVIRRERLAAQILRRAVLQGLGQVLGLDVRGAVQVGDGPGHPADAVIAAGGEPHPGKGPPHDLLAGVVQGAEPLQGGRVHLGAAPAALPAVLDRPGPIHPLLHRGGGLSRLPLGQLLKVQGVHLHEQVDAVQQGAGQAGEVLLHLVFRTAAPAGGVAVPAAFTGVHGAHQHKAAGVGHRAGGPGDLHLSVLQGLAEHLQHILLKLRQFVQKQDPRLTVVFNTVSQMCVEGV